MDEAGTVVVCAFVEAVEDRAAAEMVGTAGFVVAATVGGRKLRLLAADVAMPEVSS
jgi:hypothetical protein